LKSVKISACKTPLTGELFFPGDKSLSHRAIIFGSLAEGPSHFKNVLSGEDCGCTRRAFEAMGVKIESKNNDTELIIHGVGLKGLKAPKKELYLGNSGTSMRLLMGLLAGQEFSATLTGDLSLSSRPMKRVADPLRNMGAKIEGKDGGNLAPITVTGAKLRGLDHTLPVASAQAKSALLFAGLYADGTTRVAEPVKSRDHTERFLKYFGASIKEEGNTVSVKGGQKLYAKDFEIAGDISSAAFFMAMALLVPDSKIDFLSILNNPTRSGILETLKRMGANIKYARSEAAPGPENLADFSLRNRPLRAFSIQKEALPSLIDEIPILCVLATQAEGKSIIHDADELRVKETDRINSMVTQLSKMGANIKAERNSMIIEGPTPLRGAVVDSFKDHRTAMSLIVAGLVASGETVVQDIECINTSFPTFFQLLKSLKIPFELRG
jgi:3-phosphoshikimate 1-carboxyvinyltransferase